MAIALSFRGPTGATIFYVGAITFDDIQTPANDKNEWGIDTLVRVVKGPAPKLEEYVAGLKQGQTYKFGSATYFLQTWSPDKNPIYPEVTLNYKGFSNGLPKPTFESSPIQQSVSVSASGADSNFGLSTDTYGEIAIATREIQYVARQTTWRYIAAALANSPTYGGLDISFDPVIIQSLITVTNKDGNSFPFSGYLAPAELVTATTPAIYNLALGPRTRPIFGTPYYEMEDTVTRLFQGK